MIKKGEKIDDFLNRVNHGVTLGEEEKNGQKRLFLLPLNLNDSFVSEERSLIYCNLPEELKKKNLARVIITTIKNEPILQLNDLKVIFDTGIEEVEFFNLKQSVFHISEQQLPNPLIGMCERAFR